jgi:hypothetical protein
MKKILFTGLLAIITSFLLAQDINSIINAKEVERIEKVLSSDEMQGRRVFTPAVEKAAGFIAKEFSTIGLQKLYNNNSYLQEFSMVEAKLVSLKCSFDGKEINNKNVIVFTSRPELNIDDNSRYEVAAIKAGNSFFAEAKKYINASKNYLVLVDSSHVNNFSRLIQLKDNFFKSDFNAVFIVGTTIPAAFSIQAVHQITEQKLANVVALIPGKTKPDEYVIFSGHYDHIGTGSPKEGFPHDATDSIYNGANDDAAGTTAVLMLGKYFKIKNDNARTIVLAAFTAEEVGGFGSQYFSKQLNADKVVAMFNIEMIGTESKWGKNSAYITGYERSDMGKILQQNLNGSEFQFYPDPYPEQQLFYRSDNATLARLGVPAHTISTSKMDNEPNYHKASDEIGTLDMNNMAEIIKAIAMSSTSIIQGKDTPSKVDVSKVN